MLKPKWRTSRSLSTQDAPVTVKMTLNVTCIMLTDGSNHGQDKTYGGLCLESRSEEIQYEDVFLTQMGYGV